MLIHLFTHVHQAHGICIHTGIYVYLCVYVCVCVYVPACVCRVREKGVWTRLLRFEHEGKVRTRAVAGIGRG